MSVGSIVSGSTLPWRPHDCRVAHCPIVHCHGGSMTVVSTQSDSTLP